MTRSLFTIFPRLLIAGALGAASVARAVYAPIPEAEREKALTFYANAGSYYDTNIFGSSVGSQESLVFEFSPQVVYNKSLAKQTFAVVSYRLQWDHFLDRPLHSDLDSHRFNGKISHTFSPRFEASVDTHVDIVRNPESSLTGAGAYTAEQSFRTVTVEGRANWKATKRTNVSLRAKWLDLAYDSAALSTELDRREVLVTASAGYLVSPRTMAILEADALPVRYAEGGGLKDKDIYRLLGGLDYALQRTLALSTRAGLEWRDRRDGNDLKPYGEVGLKWSYKEASHFTFGYSYALDEVANQNRYKDSSVNRFFVSVLHRLGKQVSVGANAGWEPTILNARAGTAGNVSETDLRFGLSTTWQISPKWHASITWDRDDIRSGDFARELRRSRYGVSTQLRF